MHIAVAGNIGSGKTTLTNMLSKHYGWETHFEDVDHNPYLNDFYHDMQRWSFNLQIYYLNSRFTQVQEIKKTEQTVIQDRTIYEDAFIFAPNLHSMGLMTTRDFENYFSLFNLGINSFQCLKVSEAYGYVFCFNYCFFCHVSSPPSSFIKPRLFSIRLLI